MEISPHAHYSIAKYFFELQRKWSRRSFEDELPCQFVAALDRDYPDG